MNGSALSADVVVERRGFRLAASADVPAGAVVAVMGPSGAGKSTFLGAVSGGIPLTAGEVRVGDTVVERADAGSRRRRIHIPAARRGVVLLGQEPRLFPHLTVRENVAFGARARGVPVARARTEADEWLWRVGLPGTGDHRPAELSGGQQQRVAVARALATEPAALLLDEPLTSLDPVTAAGIRQLLTELLGTALVVTHDAVDAVALATDLVIIEHGEVVQRGAVRDVLANPATTYVAAIAGLNRVDGVARGGAWTRGDVVLASAVPAVVADGADVVAVFRPGDVDVESVEATTWTGALQLAPPPRSNEWLARVTSLEQTPAGVRVHTDLCAADVPIERAAELAPGRPVRLRIAAEHVRLRA